ncbi:hypothetical protein ACH5RR_037270 [Cinchona calisaya]|uniref:GAG-pre-integrase domain-containing protein n=1 Tax=Cinchona calisaya TaxID=153742 RepID=A0ABD2Y5M9_9GENT
MADEILPGGHKILEVDENMVNNKVNNGYVGHHAKFCKSKLAESNAATSSQKVNEPDEDWDAQVSFAVEECAFCCTTDKKDELALTIVNTNPINYNVDWIIDSGCSNHMIGDTRKLTNLTEYKGDRVVVTTDNSRLPMTHIGKTIILPRYNSRHVKLQHVYHVPEMKKNLLLVSQLTAFNNFVLFGPDEVKVCQNEKITGTPIMQGKRMETVYMMSTQEAYVDKARKNETADLWHARLGHVSYHKLKIMMMKSMLKGLPQLDVRDDIVCADHLRSKADKKAVQCIFVGYDNQRKGWRCLDPTSGKCYVS